MLHKNRRLYLALAICNIALLVDLVLIICTDVFSAGSLSTFHRLSQFVMMGAAMVLLVYNIKYCGSRNLSKELVAICCGMIFTNPFVSFYLYYKTSPRRAKSATKSADNTTQKKCLKRRMYKIAVWLNILFWVYIAAGCVADVCGICNAGTIINIRIIAPLLVVAFILSYINIAISIIHKEFKYTLLLCLFSIVYNPFYARRALSNDRI